MQYGARKTTDSGRSSEEAGTELPQSDSYAIVGVGRSRKAWLYDTGI